MNSERLRDAKAIPILEVAHRLGVEGLARAGIERVGPCPVCGGKDRFSINPNLGVFNCRGCNAGGDGVALVSHVMGCDFLPALDFLMGADAPAVDPAALAARRAKARAAEEKRAADATWHRARAIADARAIWRRALPGAGTPVQDYLAGRRILFKAWPPTLRFIPDHPMIKRLEGMDRAREIHRGPAMIAPIQSPDGQVRAVHQTWIDPARPGHKATILHPDTGAPSTAKLVRGSKKGGAIRMGKVVPGSTLVVGEGIETTASALVAWDDPKAVYWAGVDLGNMAGRQAGRNSGVPDMTDTAAFVPPAEIARLIYLQDGDSNPETTRAKLLAGLRRAKRAHPHIDILIAQAPEGQDFNDIL